jgi:hypothetical protein
LVFDAIERVRKVEVVCLSLNAFLISPTLKKN